MEFPFFFLVNSLGNFNFGFILFYLSGCLEFTLKDLEVPSVARSETVGLLFSAVPFGAILSCFALPLLRSKLTKRDLLIICDLTDFLVSLLLILQDLNIFILCRCNIYLSFTCPVLQGFTIGINSVLTNQFIFEYSHPGQFQILNSYLNFTIGFGCSFGMFLSFWVPINIEEESIYHNLIYLVPGIAGLIRTLANVVAYRYESPVEMYKSQKYELVSTYFPNDLFKCKYSIRAVYSDTKEMEKVFYHAKKTCEQSVNQNSTPAQKNLVGGYLFGIVLMSLQQFSGISAIGVYANQIFEEIFQDVMKSRYLTFIMLISGTAANFLTPKFVKLLGAKSTLSIGYSILMACLLTLGYLVRISQTHLIQYVSTLLIFMYNFVFNITLGPLTFGECALRLNDLQYNVAILSNWLSNGFSTLAFPLMQQTIQMDGIFWLFGAFCFIGLIAAQNLLSNQEKNKDN